MSLVALQATLDKGADASKQLFTDGQAAFGTVLTALPEIRVYVDGAPGIESQATTVHALERLIDAYSYAGTVTIVYAPAETTYGATPTPTPEKLALLLTGLDPAQIATATVKYGSCPTIRFAAAGAALPQVVFGFTASAADLTVDLLKTLGVTQVLRLQAYLATDPTGTAIPSRAELAGQDPIDLAAQNDKLPLLPYRFDKDATATVADDVWTWFTGQTFDPALATRTKAAQALVTALGTRTDTSLWPAAGLDQFGDGRDVVLNLALAGLMHQQAAAFAGNAIVLTLLDDLDPEALAYLTAFRAGKVDAVKAALTRAYGPPIGPAKAAAAIAAVAADLTALHTLLDPAAHLTIGKPAAGDWITPLITGAKPGDVVVIPLGSVPPVVSDALVAGAGMPSVFVGAWGANLPIGTGLPYLQLPESGSDASQYPGAPAVATEVSGQALAAAGAAAAARLALSDVIQTAGASYKATVTTVADFLGACYADGPQKDYFAGLGTYYGDDEHDKLTLALTLLLSVLPPGEGLDLDTVYTDLTAAWDAGSSSVDLIAALPKSNLATYFGGMLADGALQITAPSKDYIAKTTGGDGTTTAVVIAPPAGQTAPATTAAFQIPFDVEVHFSAALGPVQTTVTCRLADTWELPGAPWIGLSRPGFDLTVSETGIPVTGGVVGTVKDTDLDLRVAYPVEQDMWTISATLTDEPLSLAKVFALAGGANLVQMLPAPLNAISTFGLTGVQVVYDANAGEIGSMVFSLGSKDPWVFLAKPALSIAPSVDVTVYRPRDVKNRSYRFDIGGVLHIGTGDTIVVSARYPDFMLAATLTDGQILIGDLLALFKAKVSLDAAVTAFALRVQPGIAQYSLSTTVSSSNPDDPGWKVPESDPKFTIGALGFRAESSQSGSLFAFTGSTIILPQSAKIEVDVSATWKTDGGWTFEAVVPDQDPNPLKIGALLREYLKWDIGQDYDFGVKGLTLGVKTGASPGWHFTAATDGAWSIPFLPELKLTASVDIGDNWGDATGPAGKIEVGLKGESGAGILQYVDITVSYSYGGDAASQFTITWGHLTGTLSGANADGDRTATLTLADESVGSLIEEMVSWLTGSKFSLDPPWNVLDKLSLDGLALTYTFNDKDSTRNSIGLKLPVGPIDLGFCRIDALEISYRSKTPAELAASAQVAAEAAETPGVMITIDGFFPWNAGGDTGTIGPWDTSQPGEAPAPPGNGNKYFELRTLALGQHIAVPALAAATDVQAAIAALEALAPPDGDTIPPVTFDASAGWLVGADFGILKLSDDDKGDGGGKLLPAAPGAQDDYFLTAQFVFADPTLYGLRIALAGKPAKILAGLDFQIMYRQVSPTVGVYQAELTLPDAARHLSVGAFSITLPVIAVAVYTNGNFLIDIGFPWNADFSRSLTISGIIAPGIPVTGSAGLYFGVLSSATTDKVPVSTLGSFNPVVVFGFGLQIGFGADVDYGVLKAGFSVTAVGILEGVIGKFNPYTALTDGGGDSSQIQSSYYFALSGTVGVIGKLYGSIDFVVIKADVNVEVKLLLTFTYESYVSITMTVLASVEVSVTVAIDCGLFTIKLHFSFSMQLKETFTIENHGTPPWGLPPAAGGAPSTRPTGILRAPVETRISRLAAPAPDAAAAVAPVWTNLAAPSAKAALTGYLAPGLTLARDEWGSATCDVCYVAMLTLDSMTQADGSGAARAAGAGAGFSVSASPAWLSTGRLEAATIAVDVAAAGGYTGNVTLSASGLDGATIGFSLQSAPGPGTPQLTVAAPAQVQLLVTPAAATPGGSYTLTVSGVDGSGTTHATTLTLVVDSSFDVLCKTLTRWVLAAVGGKVVTAAELDAEPVTAAALDSLLAVTLKSTDASPLPIGPDAIEAFLAQQFAVEVSLPTADTAGEAAAAFFPAPPGLSIAVPSAGWSYTIGDFNSITDAGLSEIRRYFDQLAVQVADEGGAGARTAAATTTLSLGSWLFSDYFLMLARQLVQALQAGLRDFKYPIEPGQTVGDVLGEVNANAGLPGTYTAADLFIANQGRPLQAGRALAVGLSVSPPPAGSGAGRDLTTIATEWRLTPALLAGANALEPTLLTAGVTLTYADPGGAAPVQHPVAAGDTLLSVAAAFGTSLKAKVSLASLLGNTTVAEGNATPALLDSQTLLAAHAQIALPVVPYRALAGASFATIAALPQFGGGFDATALAQANAGIALLATGTEIDYGNQPPYTVAPLDCLGDVANHFGVPVAQLLTAVPALLTESLIAAASTLALPAFSYTTQAADTLGQVAAAFGVEVGLLGDAVDPATADLFATADATGAPTPYLDVPHLPAYLIGPLIEEAQRSLAFQHLASMASRFFFHGLRLPTDQLTPAQNGMWVQSGKLPPAAGLYALTGQQFPIAIPAQIWTQPFTAATLGATDPWLTLLDGDGNPTASLALVIDPTTTGGEQDALRAFALGHATLPLDTQLDELGAGSMSLSHPARFALASSIAWQSASAIDLPYGGAADPQALRIWRLPDALVNLPDPQTRALNPRFSAQVARFDEATGGTQTSALETYAWATQVEFTVKRVPAGAAAGAETYQLIGVADADVVLLERIVAQAHGQDELFDRVVVGYPPQATGAAPKGVQTDPLPADAAAASVSLTLGIAQVNLSTDTAPPTAGPLAGWRALAAQDATPLGLLNGKSQFVELLWQASITRDGGFYLFYYDQADKRGIPDRCFDDQGQATLTLLLLYAKPNAPDDQNRLTNYTNALVTGEGIDPTQSTVFTEADPPSDPSPQVPLPANASLGSLAYGSFSDLGDLAEANQALPLAAGATLEVDRGTFQAPPGGIALADVAQRFATTVPALQAANPKGSGGAPAPVPDPLPYPDAIDLPPLKLVAGTAAHTASLADVAGYYGLSVRAVAAANRDVAPVFAAVSGGVATTVTIPGGPVTRAATVPVGVEALAAERPVPAAVPAPSDPGYATAFLQNTYSLLGCQVAGNAFFKASNFGVPIGPTTQPADPGSADKLRFPRVLAEGDPWEYRRAVPYADLALEPGTSPYRAVGGLLQVAFAFQDLYGNLVSTDLSDPAATTEPLNEPPLRIGYTDPLVGLGQWPGVGASYMVTGTAPTWQVALALTFDTSRYRGVLALAADATTVTVTFTGAVDPATGADVARYTLTGGGTSAHPTAATLQTGDTAVVLTFAAFTAGVTYALEVHDVRWPGNGGSFAGGGRFTTDGVDAGSVTVPARARADVRAYDRLEAQLHDPHGIEWAIESSLLAAGRVALPGAEVKALRDWLFDGSASVAAYLRTLSQATNPSAAPPALSLATGALALSALNTDDIFELSAALTMTRSGGVVEAELETTPGIRSSTTTIAPYQDKVGSTLALDAFAAAFESALTSTTDGYKLKVATGVDRHKVTTVSSGSTLWAVRVGPSAISYTLLRDGDGQGKSTIFAPRPVSTTLQNRGGIQIYDYATGTGISSAGHAVDFSGIDVDGWCRMLFAAVDTVLAPEYTAALQIAYRRQPLGGTAYLDRLLAAKQSLAESASELMAPVFDSDAHSDQARAAFYQSLLVRLSNAYAVRAALEYRAQVTTTPATADTSRVAPRLFGDVSAAQPTLLWAAADPAPATSITVQFDDQMALGPATTPANYTLVPPGSLRVTGVQPLSKTDLSAFTVALNAAPPGALEIQVGDAVTNADGVPLRAPRTQPVLAARPRQTPLTFSAPKLPLVAGEQPLTFLLSAPDTVVGAGGEVVSHVDLDLAYDATAIEHQIEPALDPSAPYAASSWLTFLLRETEWPLDADLGRVAVPMILRDYPAVPSLPSQQGVGTGSGADLTSIRRWSYRFTYSLPFHYPQDRVDGDVQFNLKTLVEDDGGLADAFAALAEFVTQYPAIAADLQKYLAVVDPTTTDATTLTNATQAANAFAQVVEGVATAAKGTGLVVRRPVPRLAGATDLTYTFHVDEGSLQIAGADALLVTLTGALPAGVASATVTIPGWTAVPAPGVVPDADQSCFVYQDTAGAYLSAEAGQTIAERTVELDGLDILQRQDARPSVYIERNKSLIPDGPDCLEDFVYTTPPITPTSPLYPTIDSAQAIPIAAIGEPAPPPQPPPRSLVDQFTALFDALLTGNQQPEIFVGAQFAYAYSLTAQLTPLSLPVFMQPPLSVDVQSGATGAGSLTQMISDWSGAIETWFAAEQPLGGGTLWLDLMLLSDLTDKPMPLLRLRNLYLPLSEVTTKS